MPLEPHPATVPAPAPSALTRPFWEGCQRAELLYQRCEACEAAQFPPGPICRSCRSSAIVWQRSAGRGAIYSFSSIWRPPTPAYRVPYVVAIVRLDENYDMLANVVGVALDDVAVDMPVAVEFHPIAGGFSIPYFGPWEGNHDR